MGTPEVNGLEVSRLNAVPTHDNVDLIHENEPCSDKHKPKITDLIPESNKLRFYFYE